MVEQRGGQRRNHRPQHRPEGTRNRHQALDRQDRDLAAGKGVRQARKVPYEVDPSQTTDGAERVRERFAGILGGELSHMRPEEAMRVANQEWREHHQVNLADQLRQQEASGAIPPANSTFHQLEQHLRTYRRS